MREAPPPPARSRSVTCVGFSSGLNFTLETDLGNIDLLGEILGGGGYADLRSHSIEVDVFGLRLLCLDLDTLIRVKEAAGRPRDFEATAELRVIREERGKGRS